MIVGVSELINTLESQKNAASNKPELEFANFLDEVLGKVENQANTKLPLVDFLVKHLPSLNENHEGLQKFLQEVPVAELEASQLLVALEELVDQLEASSAVEEHENDHQESVQQWGYATSLLPNLISPEARHSLDSSPTVTEANRLTTQQHVWYNQLRQEELVEANKVRNDLMQLLNAGEDQGLAKPTNEALASQNLAGNLFTEELLATTALEEEVILQELEEFVAINQPDREAYQPKLAAMNGSKPVLDASELVLADETIMRDQLLEPISQEVLLEQDLQIENFSQEYLTNRVWHGFKLENDSANGVLNYNESDAVDAVDAVGLARNVFQQEMQVFSEEDLAAEGITKGAFVGFTDETDTPESEFGSNLKQEMKEQTTNELATNVHGSSEQLNSKLFFENQVQATSTEANPNGRMEQSVFQQIVERMHFHSVDEHHEVRIQLKPDHLGEVSIKMAIEQGVMTAEFTIENQSVREILATQLPELRQALQEQGILLGQVDVNLANDHRNSNEFFRRKVPVVKRKLTSQFQTELQPSIRTEDALSQVNLRV